MNQEKLEVLNKLTNEVTGLLKQKEILKLTTTVQFYGGPNTKAIHTLRQEEAQLFLGFAQERLDERIKKAEETLKEVFGVTL